MGTSRFNFAFAGEYGRVYKAYELRTDSGRIRQLQIERKGQGPAYPTYVLDGRLGLVRRAPRRLDAATRARSRWSATRQSNFADLVRVGARRPTSGSNPAT